MCNYLNVFVLNENPAALTSTPGVFVFYYRRAAPKNIKIYKCPSENYFNTPGDPVCQGSPSAPWCLVRGFLWAHQKTLKFYLKLYIQGMSLVLNQDSCLSSQDKFVAYSDLFVGFSATWSTLLQSRVFLDHLSGLLDCANL